MGTCINDSLVTVKCKGIETVIPKIVDVYNNQMGVVDRSDQMLMSYEVEQNHIKKWYIKQFMHLINVATSYSHILHKKKGGKLNPLEFRKKLVKLYLYLKSTVTVVRLQQHGEDEKVIKIIPCNLQTDISQRI